MQRVDRLGWAAGFVLAPFGTRIGVRLSDASALERLKQEVVLPGWQLEAEPESDMLYSVKVGGNGKRRGVRNYHLLYAGSGRVMRTLDFDELVDSLRQGLHQTVGLTASERTFLAGGAVRYGQRAILLPGLPGRGCSTLVKALVDRGARFLSDTFIVVDADGMVYPYPLPLTVRHEDGTDRVPAHELGWSQADEAVPAGLVVMTEFSEKVTTFRPRSLSPGQAAMHMFSNAVSARVNPAKDLPLLSSLATKVPAVKGRRPEADRAADSILRRLA